jgi:hypothetical protein
LHLWAGGKILADITIDETIIAMQPTTLKKLLPFLPGIIILIIVAVGIWAALSGKFDEGGDPRAQHINDFMLGLQDKKLEVAYQQTTPDFHRRIPFGLFVTTIKGHDVLGNFHGGEMRFVLVSGSRGWSATSSGHVSTPSGDVPVEARLEKFATGNYLVKNILVRGVPVFVTER